MKKSIYFMLVLWVSLSACQEEDGYAFRDEARIQFAGSGINGTEEVSYSFIWLDRSAVRDTVWLPLKVWGGPAGVERSVKMVQAVEYKVEYEYDNKGYVVDSTKTEMPNKAVPGVHYLPFDSPELQAISKVDAQAVRDSFPVVLLRDKSLKDAKFRLKLQLEASPDFGLGEEKCLTQVIVISDMLEKPSNWNWTTNRMLGNYSLAKHELMISVAGTVDEAWIQKGNDDKSVFASWRGKFVEALEAYNSDPDNIASGKAPMREDPDNQNSPLVTFPTNI